MARILSTLTLTLSLLALAAAPSPEATPKPQIDQQALDKLGWKLGTQAWTFRHLTLTEALDTISGLGLRYVEIYPGQPFSPEKKDVRFDHTSPPEIVDEFLAKCKAVNVTPISYGVVGLSNDEAEARKVFDFAKKLGLQTVVSEPPADAFEMLDKLAGEYQINLAIHNHPNPSRYWNPDTVLKAVEGRSPRVGACADVGHWYRSGLVPVDELKKLQGRIVELHFKDIDELAGKKEDVPWGTGKCDVPAMLAELKRQNFKGLFAIEYETGSGPEELANVARSIDYFSKQVAELAKEAK